MDDRTLAILEFDAVRERLARLTATTAGREAAAAVRPVTDIEEVVHRQRRLAEAVHLRRAGVELPLAGVRDVRAAAGRARRGAVLAPGELLEIAAAVSAAAACRRACVRVAEEAPLLGTEGGGIPDLGPLRTLIAEAIDDRGEVRDGASAELRTIRREIGQAHERVQQRMDQLLRSAQAQGALQEPLITIRDGRYVLPVRAEARGAVPGVVHDTSQSGQTVYIEPLAVVDLGNRWRELQLQERREIERILRDLSAAAGAAHDDLLDTVERAAHLDVAWAAARLAEELGATALAAERRRVPWVRPAPDRLVLVEARHPLLGPGVVPISLEVGEPSAPPAADGGGTHGEAPHVALLVTGPNTGGKTVALKTAGLLALLAQAGLPVPAAAGTQIPVYGAIFADIGDEQSIEQSLSTFSGHMTAIVDILERADRYSLVLLDELGAGTDPQEGAQLAIAIVEELRERGIPLIATTHHSELKLYAHRTAGVLNASVEFDLETLSPTYRLTLGVPGRSNALAIAARLGMPPRIIERARAGTPTAAGELETMLGDMRAELARAEERAAAATAARAEAERIRDDLAARLAAFTRERETLAHEARERVAREVREAERLVERTRRSVERARMAQAEADLARARAATRVSLPATAAPAGQPTDRPTGATAPGATAPGLTTPGLTTPGPTTLGGAAAPPPGDPTEQAEAHDPTPRLEPGRRVWLHGIAAPGEILDSPDAGGEFTVQLGALRTRVHRRRVDRTAPPAGAAGVGAAGAATGTRHRGETRPAPPVAADRIEVRGKTVEEALPEIDAFLDRAARAGHAQVQIVHGKGTGVLRRAVRDALAAHPLVTAHRSAPPAEGGEGVTVAALAAIR